MNMWKIYSVCDYQALVFEGLQGILFSILLLLSLLLSFGWILVLTCEKQFAAGFCGDFCFVVFLFFCQMDFCNLWEHAFLGYMT